tara:strand:+ start:6159 stop:6638 length:480 start_codon:yes stop_codon:yes gene_type:complete
MTRHLDPHSKFGANIRQAISICVVCQDEYKVGMVPMGNANHKYICPQCNHLQYGYQPKKNKKGMIECPECGCEEHAWIMKELVEGELIKAGYGICTRCRNKMGDKKMAFIEVKDGTQDRTGEVWFVTPPPFLKKYAEKGERIINIDKSSCEKLGLIKDA